MNNIKVAAVIPARMGSSRYPGKPLLEIEGLPMVEHVRRRALMCGKFSNVVVTTCDNEIKDAIESYGGDVLMTKKTHIMASDRVAEAADKLECSHVVNVQGDEILVVPNDLKKMVDTIESNPNIEYLNATAPIENFSEMEDSAIVKCVLSITGQILYCSRDFTHLKLSSPFEPVRKILGILAYSKSSLLNFSNLKRTMIEMTQSIDQSRVIENDLNLLSVSFEKGYPGINDKREEAQVRKILKKDKEQMRILNEILNIF